MKSSTKGAANLAKLYEKKGQTMRDQFTDEDGLEIICRNCDVTAREFFQYVSQEKIPSTWMIGPNWYCSEQCYDEATRNEG